MKKFFAALFLAAAAVFAPAAAAQSARAKNYSESRAVTERARSSQTVGPIVPAAIAEKPVSAEKPDLEVIKIETDLVIVPFRVTDKKGRNIADVRRDEVKIFEAGEEREIAYFSDIDQPFTVALVLDMSYSSVFKLKDIQEAAKKFVAQLRPADRVMVISFAERPIVL